MSERLQVLLPEEEMADVRRFAKQDSLTVGEWVRRVLHEAKMERPLADRETKLAAVRRGAEYSFPTADIDQMLEEIEQGYRG